MFDHEMHESVKGELASHVAAAAVADRPAPKLRAMVGFEMNRALGSRVGADQARRHKP